MSGLLAPFSALITILFHPRKLDQGPRSFYECRKREPLLGTSGVFLQCQRATGQMVSRYTIPPKMQSEFVGFITVITLTKRLVHLR